MFRLEEESTPLLCSSREGKWPVTGASKCPCLHWDLGVAAHTSGKTALRSFMVRKGQDFSNRTFKRDCTGAFTIGTVQGFTKTREKKPLKETSVTLCNTLKSQVSIQLGQ